VSAREPRIDTDAIVTTAAALRRRFDESFSAATTSTTERLEDLLAIRVGTDPYAVRLSEIAGLHVDPKIVSVPTRAAQFLGIVGLRGTIVPVYDLAALLRYPAAGSPRWMILANHSQPVGFAFETFETHVRVSEASVADRETQDASSDANRQHRRGTVRAVGALRPIIHMASIVKMIKDPHS
jgi:chemotaxis signal transduction protein